MTKFHLKPQRFFTTRRHTFRYTEYGNVLSRELYRDENIVPTLKRYLRELVFYYTKPNKTMDPIIKFYKNNKKILDQYKNVIITDFGEVLGPLAIISEQLLKSHGITLIPTKSKIIVPRHLHEALVDYHIDDENELRFSFSAKAAQGATNVVKAADIYDSLKKHHRNEWLNTPEYKILSIITASSTVQGSGMVAAYMGEKYNIDAFRGITPERIKILFPTSITSGKINIPAATDYAHANNLDLSEMTIGELHYHLEQAVVKEVNNRFSFLQAFKVALGGSIEDTDARQIIYVKFNIMANGKPKWVIKTPQDFRSNSMKIRSKNSKNRIKDRLGFQP